MKTRLSFDSPHLKVLLLIKCYLSDKKLPNQEYVVDLKSVFDQIIRIIQAMISLTAHKSWLTCTSKLIYLCQMLIQGLMLTSGSMMMLPHVTEEYCSLLLRQLIQKQLIPASCSNLSLPLLKIILKNHRKAVTELLSEQFDQEKLDNLLKIINRMPMLETKFILRDTTNNQKIQYTIDENENVVCVEVKPDMNCVLEFNILRHGTNNLNVFSKRFNKQKEESWFFLMAIEDNLIRMQRFVIKRTKSLDVQIDFPTEIGEFDSIIIYSIKPVSYFRGLQMYSLLS